MHLGICVALDVMDVVKCHARCAWARAQILFKTQTALVKDCRVIFAPEKEEQDAHDARVMVI